MGVRARCAKMGERKEAEMPFSELDNPLLLEEDLDAILKDRIRLAVVVALTEPGKLWSNEPKAREMAERFAEEITSGHRAAAFVAIAFAGDMGDPIYLKKAVAEYLKMEGIFRDANLSDMATRLRGWEGDPRSDLPLEESLRVLKEYGIPVP